MDEDFIYLRIAESIRRDINNGMYKPGDPMPSIRSMAEAWNCTNGTVQRALRELEAAGLVTTHVGKRTRVIGMPLQAPANSLQRAHLIHRAETFLLESMTAGFATLDVEDAFRVALNRWRSAVQPQTRSSANTLRFSGSHDLVVAWMATHFGEIAPGYTLKLNFSASLSGLTSLQKGEADIAGTHLWDESTETYNVEVVKSMFPEGGIALITMAQRRLGFILKPGNPRQIHAVKDLARPEVRYINRQPGSGTRVFLDAQLRKNKIDSARIAGYADERSTHSEIAAQVAESRADTGIGLEAAAKVYGLDFIPLTTERYELVVKENTFKLASIQYMIHWLKGEEFRILLNRMGGYESTESGNVRWIS
ncbi:MAG TPA: substrate-binding domain-containing protein [Anaerolineaceae bacterium]|nr:substrate-binding domain-containing protein [Anaerolineaceae bacterium]